LQENRSEGARKRKIYMDISSANNWILKDGASHIVVVYNVKNKKKKKSAAEDEQVKKSASAQKRRARGFISSTISEDII
jgi:hypothetical protein